ncbi:unnamed protein product [Trichobilharzia szidati]|nr:unnamed protein product [Trichobilharzia szidati]
MNGGVANIKRIFTSSYVTPCQQPTTVIRELSDMFFFDTTNYEYIPNSDSLKSSMSLGIKHSISSRGRVKHDHSHYNKHNASSSSPVVIVGGAHTDNNNTTSIMTLKNFHYPSRGKSRLDGSPDSEEKSSHNTTTSTTARSNSNTNTVTTNTPNPAKHGNQDNFHVHPYHLIIMSESEASRAIGSGAGELVQLTRNSLIQICPSPSRADSSNLNPLDIWAWGGQIVALNYQTAGLVMDLATGFFARNGACGYVLKPSLYRQFSSFFTPYKTNLLNMTERPPDTTPQILRLKIVSAQQLPKPRGSVSKGDTIEPYVVVEIHGIPVDCAEQRTVTAPAGSASGYNAIFEDTFEFCVQLGSLALVRFVVLDDHAIGDDFIGQNTVPFDCLLTGFRHIRLRSDTGEPIPLATLFVHITITSRTENSKEETHTGLLHRWRSRNRQQLQLKKVGVSTFDDIFKATTSTLRQACELRSSVLTNFDNFRRLCGETSTPLSMNQCIRALSTRVGKSYGSPDLWPVRMRIRPEDEMPHLELQNSFMGSGLSVYPSLNTLGDPSQLPLPSSSSSSITGGTTTRNSSLRFSPAPGLHRSPSLILSPRLFLNRRLKSSSKSIDEDATSTLSIDVIGCHSTHSHTHSTTHDHHHSPSVSTVNMTRRQSIHSSSSSISSFSVGRMDKLKKTVNEFEALIESCKTLIKQGPYLRVKLQQTQRTALEAYTTFLEGLKAPSSSHATAISRLTSSASSRSSSSRLTTDTGLGRLISSNSDDRNKKLTTSSTTTTTTAITPGASIYWRRMSRVADNVTWNLRLLTGQVELLTLLLNESSDWIKQAKESSTATGLLLIKPDISSISSSVSDTNSSPTYSSNHKEDEFSSGISLECPAVNKPALPTVLQHGNSSSNSNTRRSPIPNDPVEMNSNLTKNLLTPLPESPCSNQLFNTYEESELATRLTTMMTTSVTPPSMSSSSSISPAPQLTSKRSPSKVSSLYNSSSSIRLIPTINETRSTLHDKISLSPSILNTGISNNNNSTKKQDFSNIIDQHY